MSKYFHKLDRQTAQYVLYKRTANGVFLVVLGAIWGMELAGWFSQIPNHEYFVPAVLVMAGLFEVLRSMMLSPKE